MGAAMTSLVVDIRPGEKLSLNGQHHVTVELLQKSGNAARLRVMAPIDVKIEREKADKKGA